MRTLFAKVFVFASFVLASNLPLFAEELTVAEQLDREWAARNKKNFEEKLQAIPTPVTGRAMLPDGTPAIDFKVKGWGRSITHPGYGHDSFEAVTDENGRFSLDLYRPCLYWLTITDPNKVYAAPDCPIELEEPLVPDAIQFQMQKGIPVEGIVIDREKNEPIAGLPLWLLNSRCDEALSFEESEKRQVSREVKTDAQGRFQFVALPLEYTVSFDNFYDLQPPTEEEAALYTRTFTAEKEPIRLEFRIPTPWCGRLLQKDGSPAAFYPVHLALRFGKCSGMIMLVTDQNGRFMVYRPIEVEDITVDTPRQNQWFYQNFVGKELPPDPVFRLFSPLSAKGKLVRKSTGKPLGHFKFACRPGSGSTVMVLTDENGDFELTNLFLETEAKLCYLNEPDGLNTCALYQTFRSFTPNEPNKTVDLGVLELEESGWLDPNSLGNLAGKEILIEGMMLDGRIFDWTKYAGKVILVDFWATWCAPCIQEIPRLKNLYGKYHEKGFEVVGISVDEDLKTLEEGLGKYQLPWTILADEKLKEVGKTTMSGRFAVGEVPRCILVGRDGKVVSVEARGEKLEAELERLFEGH